MPDDAMALDVHGPGVSRVDADTLKAYRETLYRVHGQFGFTLRIGQPSPALLSVHQRHKVDCSAFLTACNPFSRSLDVAANAVRQAALGRELARRSLSCLPGTGQHPSNGWPGEESFLALGLTLESAKALGTRFEQNALVWSGIDAVPRLILLR